MAAALQHPVIDVELEPSDAGRRPGRTGQLIGQLVDQEVEQLLAHRQGIRNAEHELDVCRGFHHAFINQCLGVVEHRCVENLDLGLHLVGAGQRILYRLATVVEPVELGWQRRVQLYGSSDEQEGYRRLLAVARKVVSGSS